MQLTRLLFLTPEKTYERKIKEVILAFQIEKNFTKEEILTLYCNQIYFGHGNYGVEAASRFFFGKPVKRPDASTEAALIAGHRAEPVAPVARSRTPSARSPRRNHVLDRMAEEKYVSREEAEAAKAQPLGLRLRREPPSIAPHFLEEVRKYLEREYGSQRIYQGGLRVYTTLDPRAAARGRPRAARRPARARPPRARLRAAGADVLLKDGLLPDPLHLDEWDWPFAAGDVVRGVVHRLRPHDRGRPDRRRTARGSSPADVAWTRRTSVAEVLPRGAVAPFRIVSLSDEGGRKEAKVALEQEPKVEGALLRARREDGRGARDGRRLRLRAQQVQPRDPGDAPGGLGLQADRLLGGARDARLDAGHASSSTRRSASRTRGTRRSGRRRTTTARTWGPIPLRRPSSRAGTSRR